jgi:DNA-binding MarR family transcriptional regulator
MSFVVQDLLGRVADRHQLSLSQVRLLGILRDREPGMLELARHLNLEKSSVSGLVDRAEHRGLVERKPDVEDGRAVHVSITPAGRAVAERIQAALTQPFTDLLTHLPPRQRAQLTRLLRDLLDDH